MLKVRIRYAYVVLILLTLLASLQFPFLQTKSVFGSQPLELPENYLLEKESNRTFIPAAGKPAWVDGDNNGISDTLDREISDQLAEGAAASYANVTVILRTQPTVEDANAFALLGGYLTTAPWTHALYGFGGQIPYNRIADFAQLDANVLLVEKTQTCHATIAYAAKQIGARPYVWETLDLQGDPQSSVAIVDTGIDDAHADFTPGFGELNFSKKIVGWSDFVTSGTASPYDDEGHGSHVAGLAAGNGFFSTDVSGNAVATWGANFGRIWDTGTYLVSGMMVNKTGTITIKVKWMSTGTGKLSALPLYYGDKTLNPGGWTHVASVSTPTEDTWYTLTYTVPATPTGGYDMYHVTMSLTAGTGNVYVVFTMSWPYEPPTDGFANWAGIAPHTRLVGVKVLDSEGSGSSNDLIDAIDWIIANREAYHIVVTSMSLGFDVEVFSVDSAVLNLVNSGVTTIVSAGNSGSGANNIYTPGSVDEAITVAATNQFDNIASYSSQGGPSRFTGQTVKPDITAPGGSFYATPLFSADSDDWDAAKQWMDVLADDGAPMQGTSMSAPIVAGAASILIQALGGFSDWQYTRSQALLPKMLLLMTATETYPGLREPASAASPTLDRGDKDPHEGYGRMNLDAAVDAVLNSYLTGTVVEDALGKPPTLSDISGLGQRLAWARHVQLVAGHEYTFSLSIPPQADYDLYLYNATHDGYGQPVILARSINASTGTAESFTFAASATNTGYIVVKRVSGSGAFSLLSSEITPGRDVAVLDVAPSADEGYVGDIVDITVVVGNYGPQTETFNVTVSFDDNILETQVVVDLVASTQRDLVFSWDTTGVPPCHNYTIAAEASAVPDEVNTANNNYVDGTVKVKMAGDINGDGVVDVFDLSIVAVAYGSRIGQPKYDPEADLNEDGIVDLRDLAIVTVNYGNSCL